MKRIVQSIKDYMYNVDIDINERLSECFINIGIVAAILGVIICLIAHTPVIGTIATSLIVIGTPIIATITRYTGHHDLLGDLLACMVIVMIPIIWLTTGASSGGTGFWFLYELFFISIFAEKKQLIPYYAGAAVFILAAVLTDYFFPEMFFHFTNSGYALFDRIACGTVVIVNIMIMVLVQKLLYINEHEITATTQDNTRNFVKLIANTIDSKDPYTGGHSRRVAECASAIALKLGMSQKEADNMHVIGLLHDIGKIGVPDHVLNKPGRLTDEEFAMIRKHPVYGAEILQNISMIPHVIEGVRYHHERYDGNGYPDRLVGEDIPFVARIIAVADSYDAMSTSRIYRRNLSRDEIINEFIRCSGTQFDPHIAEVFVEMLKEGFEISGKTEYKNHGAADTLNVTANEMIQRILVDAEPKKRRIGATYVDNVDFINLYDYLRNLSLRDGDKIILAEIFLDPGEIEPEGEKMHNYMMALNNAIIKNIRAVDICTKNSLTSYLVLFMNAPREHVNEIFSRVRNVFFEAGENTEVKLCCRLIESAGSTK